MDNDGGSNVELLDVSHNDNAHSKSGVAPGGKHTRYSNRSRWLPFADVSEAFAFSLLPVSVVPILLLALFAPRLASKLSSSACLPNGQFIIPGTASIWNPAYIFTITITVGGKHSYTYVKIIDTVWDVLVGRGGQALLVWIAYRTFHKCMMYVMQTQPIPYSLYGAIAFDAGSLHSITQFVYTLSSSQPQRSWRVVRIYVTIALCTLYVAAMPTLFSAMTGYAAVSTPSVEVVNGYYREGASPDFCQDMGNCSIMACQPGLEPIWAIVWDSARYGQEQPYWISQDSLDGDPVYKYYMEHEQHYLTAKSTSGCVDYNNGSSLDNCAPLQKSSTIMQATYTGTVSLEPPLLNIDVLGNNAHGSPAAFKCPSFPTSLVFHTWQINKGGENGISALCTAGSSYQWGFSFLLLLIVCILNLIFAAMMYGLWVDARRQGNLKTNRERVAEYSGGPTLSLNSPSNLRSALDIAKQAELQHGKEVHDWPSWKLEGIVWRGSKGIRLVN